MGLITHGLALGIGYVLGRPDGRQKVAELARHPAVRKLRNQGQDLAVDGLRSAKQQLSGSRTSSEVDGTPGTATPGTATSAPVPSPAAPRLSNPSPLTEGVLPPTRPGE